MTDPAPRNGTFGAAAMMRNLAGRGLLQAARLSGRVRDVSG